MKTYGTLLNFNKQNLIELLQKKQQQKKKHLKKLMLHRAAALQEKMARQNKEQIILVAIKLGMTGDFRMVVIEEEDMIQMIKVVRSMGSFARGGRVGFKKGGLATMFKLKG